MEWVLLILKLIPVLILAILGFVLFPPLGVLVGLGIVIGVLRAVFEKRR